MLDLLPEQQPETLRLQEPVPLALHPAAVYLDSLGSERSKATMREGLNIMARMLTCGECDAMTLNWAALRYKHTAALRSALEKKYAPATVNQMLCALRRVLKEALRLDLIDPIDYSKAVDVRSIKQSGKVRGRALTLSEIAALMQSCSGKTPIDVRDKALIAILRGGGIRRGEAVNLLKRDFNLSTGALFIREGKGKKDRTVYLPKSACVLVSEWLELRGETPGPLLYPIRKGGEIQRRRMTEDGVLKIVQRRAKLAGVESFSPHDFRRTFCSDLLDAGVDIVTVQKLAGHASPVTTAKYDRRGEETKRRAVQHLEF
ncbi:MULTISPECIES: tyrosine-type recombinase/integrase [unclassified Microcoleus]|uniref:tyrosine-type recombinase/integrase n=1 Tax=unclassified Microcoleus TaxID=2642155 RepID=UPI001DD8497F|nr:MULTISPECIES: tyrosine-type recombinase/integrase [unclassified Microcoleus]MCC3415144.1 tyrosine-type recombinase/integrase [Microcoleus sp. PH2017_02_FOX_O_A]MCC3519339.1 tyrosine-type recombinase/integrase [Microcoleus sp. PH2017_18_LLB_O_A]